MKKWIITLIILFIWTITIIFFFQRADYRNVSIEIIKQDSIVVAPETNDPEAEYPVYEVYFNEDTIVEGEKSSVNELKLNDKLHIWIMSEEEGKGVAKKILVKG